MLKTSAVNGHPGVTYWCAGHVVDEAEKPNDPVGMCRNDVLTAYKLSSYILERSAAEPYSLRHIVESQLLRERHSVRMSLLLPLEHNSRNVETCRSGIISWCAGHWF